MVCIFGEKPETHNQLRKASEKKQKITFTYEKTGFYCVEYIEIRFYKIFDIKKKNQQIEHIHTQWM